MNDCFVNKFGIETMTRFLAAALAGLSIVVAQAAAADELVVLSAAAVRPGLMQVPPVVAKATGHHLTVSFGNATAIRDKVVAGDRVDIVILPPMQIDELIGRGLLLAAGRANLGVVRLGIAARAGGGMRPVATVDEFKQALASAPSFGMPDPADGSTSSVYLAMVLQQLGIAEAMRAKTKLFLDGTKALEAVAKGEIALTVAPITSIFTVAGVELLGPLPETLQLRTVYAAALANRSTSPAAANALLKLLTSSEVATLFKAKGIDPPGSRN
jgi:molybdate transport system substrate-binding protein